MTTPQPATPAEKGETKIEKSSLEKAIRAKAVKRFEGEMVEFNSINNVIFRRLLFDKRCQVLHSYALSYPSLVLEKLTNFEELKEELIKKFEIEETEKILEGVKGIAEFVNGGN